METNKKAIGKGIFKTILSVILGLVASCLAFVLMFGGCFPYFNTYEIYESGYYRYIVETHRYLSMPNVDYAIIVGFTEFGLQQTTLDIPRELDGLPVEQIGLDEDRFFGNYLVYSKNLQKVYVHENIRRVAYCEKGAKEATQRIELMVCSISPYDNPNFVISIYHMFSIEKIYYYRDLIETTYIGAPLSPANVVFMNNYSNEVNQGYYRLDHIGAGETIPAPPAPSREGYLFEGWYQEAECVNAWDFRKSPEIEEGEEFRLYAKWRVE